MKLKKTLALLCALSMMAMAATACGSDDKDSSKESSTSSSESAKESSKEESSSSIQKRVSAAWVIQKERFVESSTIFNGRMTKSEVEQYCQLDAEGQRLMKKAYSAFSLTGRSYFKILKTARTIADLEQSPDIKARHLEEALYFRQKEKGNVNER